MDDPERSRAYHRRQFRLSALGFAVTVAYLVAWLATGASIALRDALVAFTPHWWLQVPLALLVLGIGHRLVTLPLSWVSGFLLPRRFGLLHQPFRLWLADVAKAGAIATLLGIVATLVVYALLRATAWWWLWGALLFLLGYALLALAAPTLLIPLFYRLTPLQDGDLRARLLRVAARAGVPVLGVWVADQSRKSRTANAAVVGLGRTRRILLFDTLLSELAADEIETVLAHELGHQVHGDIGRGLLVQAALTLGTFWIADHALRAGHTRARPRGARGPRRPAALRSRADGRRPVRPARRQRLVAPRRAPGGRLRAAPDRQCARLHRRDGAPGCAEPRGGGAASDQGAPLLFPPVDSAPRGTCERISPSARPDTASERLYTPCAHLADVALWQNGGR